MLDERQKCVKEYKEKMIRHRRVEGLGKDGRVEMDWEGDKEGE